MYTSSPQKERKRERETSVCVCLGGGGWDTNLSGATLKKQSHGPVNLGEPDSAWFTGLL